MEILVVGYEFCVHCPEARKLAERFAREHGIGYKYIEVDKDETATKLYEEASRHGYDGVPQVYIRYNGLEYFIMLGVPDTYEEFKKSVMKMIKYYKIPFGESNANISKTK